LLLTFLGFDFSWLISSAPSQSAKHPKTKVKGGGQEFPPHTFTASKRATVNGFGGFPQTSAELVPRHRLNVNLSP
jgi:hypothetical protein